MTDFNSLGLAEPIARAIAEEGYTTPTPIQAQAIPPALEGRDLVGIAQTGTGKTAGFALPILNRLAANPRRPEAKSMRVLVLAPTRELGGQIVDSFQAYGRHMRLRTALAIGGVPIGRQIRAMQSGVDILVATPGRLLDLIDSRAVRFDLIEVFVLDEADRMLDMGFIRDIRKIVALVPEKRQTLFFSATMAPEIARLADDMLREPVRVEVTPAATTVERIEQTVMRVEKGAKPRVLVDLLKGEGINRALVFTRTKHGADRVVKALGQAGIASSAIHGNKTQANRERTLAMFSSGEIRTMVATDIAARGIDVDGVSHVVNYDLPEVPDTYVHRIGRTARAGADGIAVSLVSGEEMPLLRDIEKLIRRRVPVEGQSEEEASAADAALEVALASRDRSARKKSGGRGNGGQRQPREARANREPREARRPRQNGEARAEGQGEQRASGENRAPRSPDGENRGPRKAFGKRNGPRRDGNGAKAQNGNGGNREGNRQRGPERDANSRPEKGIGGVGFLSRGPRRGGMQQGSASISD